MKRLDEKALVAGQIRPDEMANLAASGVTMIVNNRPDGEEPGQPAGAEIAAAAESAGIAYRHIPIAGGFNLDDVMAMADALDSTEGAVLAFCKSGTRSTFLWALARSERGADRDDLIARAAAAGYDLSPIAAYLN
jgi:uncharacterized protein (TIGR01244 family)